MIGSGANKLSIQEWVSFLTTLILVNSIRFSVVEKGFQNPQKFKLKTIAIES